MSNILKSELLMGYGRAGCGTTQQFADSIPVSAVEQMFDWKAVEVPVYADFVGQKINLQGRKALVRIPGGIPLGSPSAKYAPHNYETSLLGGVQRILGGGLAINAAGMTGYGAKAWISVSLADTVCTPEGVEFLPFLMAMGSHDSTIATTYKRSALLLICNNQLGALHRDKGSEGHGMQAVKVRHTANSGLRLDSAQQALGILAQTEDEFARQIRELCEQEITEQQWSDFVKAYVPLDDDAPEGRGRTMAENKREQLTEMYRTDPRVSPWRGNLFGVVQCVNTWDHHVSTVRNAERSERNAERSMSDYYDQLDSNTLAVARRVLAHA